jgi:ribonuclease P protein component
VIPLGAITGEPDRRFPRAERLTLGREFRRVYDQGSFFPGTFLVLYVFRDPFLTRKAGFVAGRKVGNAVARNRAKRLLRETYRHHRALIPDAGNHLVLVARKGCGEAAFAAVDSDFLALLTRAGLSARAPGGDEG